MVNAKSNAAFRPKLPVPTPMWFSRGLWPRGGGNSYRGPCIHVPARVMGKFAILCPVFGSCFMKFRPGYGSVCDTLSWLWVCLMKIVQSYA